ncbi:peptidoglycan DD-metalloendopeptidase family protein [Paenisporosarcina cavernae]|uniref:SPOR domain-containing protein n=1 Tax=Paenisporosarcina cavernae TaxID=2320858 RepID=A0A385YSY0_9BACL|nr:peptidoglycan DD-metalloendopeptidase family protein [Paenisporosarcina cavernae]AYC29634.1 hypothetical protein D3873_06935 [Paenisporosarcina cavernae]
MANFIKPCEGRITSPFGWRNHPIRKVRSWHQGVDIAQKGNVPIHAAADGTVIRVGPLGTYGNIVLLRHNIHGKTFETNYAHLRDGSIQVKVGQKVKQGEVIAYMGSTGSSTAQHLHFEIHDGKWATGQPNAVDPELYMAIPEVVELQEKLNKLGASLEVDGINGSNTSAAVKQFQKEHDLVADGKAGPVTLGIIAELLAKPKTVTPGVYRIKTGTFGSAKSFAEALEKLKDKFGWVLYEAAESLEYNPSYRIYTGTFSTKESVEEARMKIEEAFGWTTYLIDETK